MCRIWRSTVASRTLATVNASAAIHVRPSSLRLEPTETAACPADQRGSLLAAARQTAEVHQLDHRDRRLDRGERGEAPLVDGGPADGIGRQRAGLLGQVEQDGARLGDDDTAVIDHRYLVERADRRVRRTVELAAGVVERMDAVRQPELLERPLHAQVACLADDDRMDPAESIKCDHSIVAGIIDSPGLGHAAAV